MRAAVFTFMILALLLNPASGDFSRLVEYANTFARRLYEKLSQKPGNLLVCPLSLYVSLCVMLRSSYGKTAWEIATTLGFEDADFYIQELVRAAHMDPSGYNHSYGPYELTINVYPSYTYHNDDDIISKESLNRLTGFSPYDYSQLNILWRKQFNYYHEGNFTQWDGTIKETRFIGVANFFFMKRDDYLNATILKMHFEDPTHSILFILPHNKDDLPFLEDKLAGLSIDYFLYNLKRKFVYVLIPKFIMSSRTELKEALISMGIEDIFSNISPLEGQEKDVYVRQIRQEITLNLNEHGKGKLKKTDDSWKYEETNKYAKVFFAKHPFPFIIYKTQPSVITLFTGRLADIPTD